MPLMCNCDYSDEFDWYYEEPNDYSVLSTAQRKRCASCHDLINLGAVVTKFFRWRTPKDDIEINIYGDCGEVPLATWYLCEECSDLYFSLDELGFCNLLGGGESMRELVKEYAEVYGPQTSEINNGHV